MKYLKTKRTVKKQIQNIVVSSVELKMNNKRTDKHYQKKSTYLLQGTVS